MNYKIFKTAHRANKRRQQRIQQRTADSDSTRQHQAFTAGFKLAKTIVIILGCFCGCWFPLMVSNAIQIYANIFTVDLITYGNMALYFAVLNSALNPGIYAWKINTFRAALFRLFGRN